MPQISHGETDAPQIHYAVEGAGPHVTLVHGVGADLHSWDEVAARLVPSFTVVRLDLRGQGRSGRIVGGCTLDDLASDVRLVWGRLGIEKTHLAGFSLGGLIAQSLALSDPQRIDRLAIISAVAGRTPDEPAAANPGDHAVRPGARGAAGAETAPPLTMPAGRCYIVTFQFK